MSSVKTSATRYLSGTTAVVVSEVSSAAEYPIAVDRDCRIVSVGDCHVSMIGSTSCYTGNEDPVGAESDPTIGCTGMKYCRNLAVTSVDLCEASGTEDGKGDGSKSYTAVIMDRGIDKGPDVVAKPCTAHGSVLSPVESRVGYLTAGDMKAVASITEDPCSCHGVAKRGILGSAGIDRCSRVARAGDEYSIYKGASSIEVICYGTTLLVVRDDGGKDTSCVGGSADKARDTTGEASVQRVSTGEVGS